MFMNGAITKVLIVDDHGFLREGLISLLRNEKDIVVIGAVENGENAVNLANELSPDVILMDIVMQGMTGIEATHWIKGQNPKIKIILISGEINKNYITDGIKSGIDGYLPKDVDPKSLVTAIHTVVKGERYFSPDVTALIFQDYDLKGKDGKGVPSEKESMLTKREEEILILIAQGKSLEEIGSLLFIDMKTVENHYVNIKHELQLHNTAQLVMYAVEHNLVEINRKRPN